MKNLHLLDADKPSRLFYLASNLHLEQGQLISPKNYQNIYITSDEEIKEGDYCIITDIESVLYGQFEKHRGAHQRNDQWKKIILTTDGDLIKDGVQAPDDEFLEWYVNNPSCESVEVEIETTSIQLPQQQLSENSYDLAFRWINKKVYKIIIPKEEPKQETLDEAAERLYPTTIDSFTDGGFDLSERERLIFINGAEWQQERSYSEEEVVQLLIKFNQEIQEVEDVRGWFEQFKKK